MLNATVLKVTFKSADLVSHNNVDNEIKIASIESNSS